MRKSLLAEVLIGHGAFLLIGDLHQSRGHAAVDGAEMKFAQYHRKAGPFIDIIHVFPVGCQTVGIEAEDIEHVFADGQDRIVRRCRLAKADSQTQVIRVVFVLDFPQSLQIDPECLMDKGLAAFRRVSAIGNPGLQRLLHRAVVGFQNQLTDPVFVEKPCRFIA